MNKIIPFNKEITFNDSIGEIVSIALDEALSFSDLYTISGNLTIRGTNKKGEQETDFSYTLPVLISVDSKYNTEKSTVNVDDFYYEIINDNILRVKIDLLLDNLAYQEEDIKPLVRDIPILDEEEKDINLNINLNTQEENMEKDAIIPDTLDTKEYAIYRVYLVGNNDTIESILDKYQISKELLENYNDLTSVKPGTKLIIPSLDE